MAVIISLMPFHAFTDGNMDLARIVNVKGNLNKRFPQNSCTIVQTGHNVSIELLFSYVKTSVAK